MSETKLSTKLASVLEFSDIEIPAYITQNLAKTLREYQVNALKHYLIQRKKPNTNHLMFNMATGSGKTLIMAALMIECYKQGYRNFVFFVDSVNILEKTRANFSDEKSEKYLFSESLEINGSRVYINVVNNFSESRENCINIIFDTIQGLFSLFKNERENSITLEDLKKENIVFLADEAHHLNSDTKNKGEVELKESWESIINKAFRANSANLMLEFTATIPRYSAVLEKYSDKIVFEYALKQFYHDKFSKKIYLLKYENIDLKYRFLGAIVLNIFRQLVAFSANLTNFKPVILFKSEREKASLENESAFKNFVANLKERELETFFSQIANDGELLALSKEFFAQYFKNERFYAPLLAQIQATFNDSVIINMNSKDIEKKRQILINSLESRDNPIRVIFAVDKLNEGWDVLNLFDIVRCKNSDKTKNNKNITTKEAQLIGRGARYYPFKLDSRESSDFCDSQSAEFKRKFDNDTSKDSRFLRALEALSYHTLNELDFIKELNKSLNDMGLAFENLAKKVILKPQQKARDFGTQSIKVVANKRVEKPILFQESVTIALTNKKIPLFVDNKIKENEAYNAQDSRESNLDESQELLESHESRESHTKRHFLNKIDEVVFLKALNKARFLFSELHARFGVKNKREFIDRLYKISCEFHEAQGFSREAQLKIATFVLENLRDFLAKQEFVKQYEVLDFEVRDFSLKEREIYSNKEVQSAQKYAWLVYDKLLLDSELEREFLDFIESIKERIDEIFSRWIVIRNEQFSELTLYDNRKSENSYGKGIAPDFIFYGKRESSNEPCEVIMQCFIESKGEHLVAYDAWKEAFLESLAQNKTCHLNSANIHISGMPFFRQDSEDFKERFARFIND